MVTRFVLSLLANTFREILPGPKTNRATTASLLVIREGKLIKEMWILGYQMLPLIWSALDPGMRSADHI